MVTAFLGYGGFLQDSGYNGLSTTLYPNGLYVFAPNVQMVATGYTARRQVVATANCNACHLALGLFTGVETATAPSNFHSGYMNDANACAICHIPNQADGGGWSARIDYWVHSIHAAAKRTVPFVTSAGGTSLSLVTYPGVLKNCTACHLPGTYDFSAPTSAAALPNLLYTTVASGTTAVKAAASTSPYVTVGTTYGAGFSYSFATGVTTQAAGTTLVISPIMTACVACHDGVDATGVDPKQHMMQNGGAFYVARSTLYKTGTTTLQNSESCLLCHGTGQVADIAVVHAQSAN
jgi:OmcA/MtrC family decaheme c-type cytochrome